MYRYIYTYIFILPIIAGTERDLDSGSDCLISPITRVVVGGLLISFPLGLPVLGEVTVDDIGPATVEFKVVVDGVAVDLVVVFLLVAD